MMNKERRKEKRYASQASCRLFFVADNKETSAPLEGKLVDISLYGAGVRLANIIVDRLHLAYGAQDSPAKTLHITITLPGDEQLTVPCRVAWYNKELDNGRMPFRLGLEFLQAIDSDQLVRIRQ